MSMADQHHLLIASSRAHAVFAHHHRAVSCGDRHRAWPETLEGCHACRT